MYIFAPFIEEQGMGRIKYTEYYLYSRKEKEQRKCGKFDFNRISKKIYNNREHYMEGWFLSNI